MSQNNKGLPGCFSSLRNIASLIVGAVVVVGGFIFSQVTGIDLLGINETNDTNIEEPAAITEPNVESGGGVTTLNLGQALGAVGDYWTVYFTAPTGSRDYSVYENGIDVPLSQAINNVQSTLDIAAFEWNNPTLTQAVLDAQGRGVRVRLVVDDEHTLEDDDSTILELEDAGIPIVDDDRSGLMHNKFMIMDSQTVWMGSMNYTINGVYRNNNNALALTAPAVVNAYQAEFDEMFSRNEFGITSSEGNGVTTTVAGHPLEVHFASEDDVIGQLLAEINGAQSSIEFMAFSFTRDDMGQAILERAQAGVNVRGIFERLGSGTQWSELTRFYCAGLDAHIDGSDFILHHKVVLVDEATVITGSFNFSNNAVESNDENVVIVQDANLAAQYRAEFERRWAESIPPDPEDMDC